MRGRRQAGRPAVRPKPASSASRAAAHNRPWGGKCRRAGGRGDALGNLEAHRRRSRCRQALRPLHTARSISATAAHCLPRAPTYSCSYTSPTRPRRRAAAASCARTSTHCASSRNRRPVPAFVRARLRARGWVPGRGASGESRVETPAEQGENRNLPCALEAWTSEDDCMSRDGASCARTAEAGVIPGRHCGESRLPSSRALVGRCTCIHRTRDFDARFVRSIAGL